MTPRIHPSTIEAVKERTDIVDVISEHIVLKRKGKEYVGICPFHDDTKPSMTVSPSKQFYYCFSCGAGGNAIKFLMDFSSRNFSDVVLELAKKSNINVDLLDESQKDTYKIKLNYRDQLFKVLLLSKDWFKKELNSDMGKEALDYLKSIRSISNEAINKFELGFSPNKWNSLTNYLHLEQGIPLDLIVNSGMGVYKKNNSGIYDRFRNRLMIPIFDRQNRVIGFGGRSLDGSEPKYLNSPETEIFEKGKQLFGFDKAVSSIRKKDRAVVVEGYFDVIALQSLGIDNSVASLGTALNKYQISQICRCTESKKVILNFDSDNAGKSAAKRAISELESLAIQNQIDLRILNLPSGKDPDEYLKQNSASSYIALLDQSPVWFDWEIDNIFEGIDTSTSEGFQSVVTSLVKLLGKLPQSAIRTHYLQKVSERLSRGQARLAIKLEQDLRRQVKGYRWHGQSNKFELPNEVTQREKNEAELIFYYLHCPSYRSFIRKELKRREIEDFSINHHRLIWAAITTFEEEILGEKFLLEICSDHPELSRKLEELDLMDHISDRIMSVDVELSKKYNFFMNPNELILASFSNPENYLIGVFSLLERYKSVKRCRHLIESWSGQRLRTVENCIALLIDKENEDNSSMETQIDNMFLELNSDAINFQKLYYTERKHISSLDQQRCGNFFKINQ
tara:strand:+ start:4083 stop:6119 length:2037 start_codon:yes stop_codon:yes gene_type:complete